MSKSSEVADADRPAVGPVRRLRGASIALGVGFAAWIAGLLWFALEIPDGPTTDTSTTDAIVVLTGGSGRIEEGLALFERRRARDLFVSGVDRSVDLAALLRDRKRDIGAMSCCIRLGRAVDTIGNARETARWMRAMDYRSLRLVTASYHMRRSLMEFQRAMPNITIIAHPTFPKGFVRDRWWARMGSSLLLVREYHKFLAASLRNATSDVFSTVSGGAPGIVATSQSR